ncbi:MAG: hypothetical protein ACLP1X_07955, partial [Polyangiaceae bacterium]
MSPTRSTPCRASQSQNACIALAIAQRQAVTSGGPDPASARCLLSRTADYCCGCGVVAGAPAAVA